MTFQQKIKYYKEGNVNIDLNMNHLKGCFGFWMIGMGISLGVFLKEISTRILSNKTQIIAYNN